MKKKIEVSLLGQKFMVRSEQSEEHVHAIAKHVAQQIEDIQKQSRGISSQQVALLVALNLADELSTCRAEIAHLKGEIKERTSEALHDVERVLSLLPQEPTVVSDKWN